MKYREYLVAYADDLLYLAGCVLILIFVFHVAPVYCWLVGGLMCIGASILIGLTQRSPKA
jgi:uncharacterized membrane protein SirB2